MGPRRRLPLLRDLRGVLTRSRSETSIRPFAAALAAVLFLSGCQGVVTLNPAIPGSARITDDRIVGSWLSPDDSVVVSIAHRGSRPSYTFEIDEKGKKTRLDGWLARAEGRLLLELNPAEPDSETSGSAIWPTIQTYAVMILEVDRDTIRVFLFDPDTLASRLRSGQLRVPYTEVQGSDIVVGGSTDLLWPKLSQLLVSRFPLDTALTLQRIAGPR